jgi:hypothetical protein
MSTAWKGACMKLDPEMMEKLAEAAHNVWMEGKLRDGWQYGPVTDKEKKFHNCLVPYDQLSETDKESDRDLVRGIPRILKLAGYKIVRISEQ